MSDTMRKSVFVESSKLAFKRRQELITQSSNIRKIISKAEIAIFFFGPFCIIHPFSSSCPTYLCR